MNCAKSITISKHMHQGLLMQTGGKIYTWAYPTHI